MPYSFPDIDPIALQIGPLAIRWYSLAYVAGIVLGWWVLAREHARRPITGMTKKALDDIIMWAVIGIILGGRLGYVLFYKPDYYLEHPGQILHIWEGGMSFHGGFLGVVIAFFLFCKRYGIRFLAFMDVIAAVAPIGLFFGRIANFINGELYGRITDSPLGMVFPYAGDLPRHPSQLYEATLEGLVLFCILFFLMKRTNIREREGALCGLFLIGYGLARIICEFFREPDAYLGFLYAGTTMGQLLCLPMLLGGAYLLVRSRRA